MLIELTIADTAGNVMYQMAIDIFDSLAACDPACVATSHDAVSCGSGLCAFLRFQSDSKSFQWMQVLRLPSVVLLVLNVYLAIRCNEALTACPNNMLPAPEFVCGISRFQLLTFPP